MRELPHGWEVVPFGELATFRNGINFTREGKGAAVKIVGVGDFGVRTCLEDMGSLGAVNVGEGLAPDDCLQDGDLLFVRSNGNKALIGRCMSVHPDGQRITFSGFTIRARVTDERLGRRFARRLFTSELFYRRLHERGGGTNISNLNQRLLAEFPIVLPPLRIQDELEECLETWDRAIAGSEALLSKKQQAKRALKQKLVAPCVSLVPPSGWRQLRLGEAFGERDVRGEELRLLAITGAGGIVDRDTIERRDTSTADKSAYKVIRPGDIGYNTMRMWQGVSGLSGLTGLVSPAYTVVTPTKGVIDPRFAAYLFKLPAMIHRFWRYSQGLVDDQLQLRFEHFSEITVNLPPLSDQEEIADLFDAVDQEIGLLSRQLQALRQQKRGLMQKLLTGEWKLGEAKVPEAAE